MNRVIPSGKNILCSGLNGLQDEAKRVEFFRSEGRKTHCAKCTNLDRCSRESASFDDLPPSSDKAIAVKQAMSEEDKGDSTFCPAMDELHSAGQVSTSYARKGRCIQLSSHSEINKKSCQDPKCESTWCLCNTCVDQIPPGQEKIFLKNNHLAELCRVEPGTKHCSLHNQEPMAEQDFSQYFKKKKAIIIDLPSNDIDDDSPKNKKEEGRKMEKPWKEMTKEERLNAMKNLAAQGKTTLEAAEELGVSHQTPRNYAEKHGFTFAPGEIKADSGDKRKRGMNKGEKEKKAKRIRELLKSGKHPDDIVSELQVHISTVYNHKKEMIKTGELPEGWKAAVKKKGDKKKKVKKTAKKTISIKEINQKFKKPLGDREVKRGRRIQIIFEDDSGIKQEVATVFTDGNKKTVVETGKERITVESLATNAD